MLSEPVKHLKMIYDVDITETAIPSMLCTGKVKLMQLSIIFMLLSMMRKGRDLIVFNSVGWIISVHSILQIFH